MKRSEAEKKINDWLKYANEITGETIIDFLIDELEFLPPAYETKYWDRTECGYFKANEWEDEE